MRSKRPLKARFSPFVPFRQGSAAYPLLVRLDTIAADISASSSITRIRTAGLPRVMFDSNGIPRSAVGLLGR